MMHVLFDSRHRSLPMTQIGIRCLSQVGLDDVLHAWFQRSSIHTGEACLKTGVIPRSRLALQTGAPPALRPRLWATALALDLPQASIEARFQGLCSQVEECNLITDLLVSLWDLLR